MQARFWSDGRPARPRQTRQAPQKSKCDPYQGTHSGGPMLPVKAEQKFAAAKNIDNCYGRVAYFFAGGPASESIHTHEGAPSKLRLGGHVMLV